MQRGRGAQDDEERDQVGERHADEGVDLDAAQVAPHRGGAVLGAGRRLRVFHLLSGLPEEEVWADRRAEHRHHGQQHRMRGRQLRLHDRARDLPPVEPQREGHRHVRQQRQRQPLEPAHVALVRQPHLQRQAEHAEGGGIGMRGATHQEAQRLGHRGQVGRQV
jgi:hypothetical protein